MNGPKEDSRTRTRLADTSEVLGFRLDGSDGVAYCTVNGAWQSEVIESDFEEPSTGLRDQAGAQLYWGDIVLTRDAMSGNQCHFAVLGGSNASIRLANLKTRAVTAIDLQHPLSRKLGTKVGRIGDWSLSAELRAQLEAIHPLPRSLPNGVMLWNILALCMGLAAAIAIQWLLNDSVGPVLSCLGVCLAQGSFLFVSHKRSFWMSRARLLRLAALTAATLFAFGFCISFLVATEWTLSAALAYGCSGAILSGTFTILSGDIISWITGGYGGELPKGKWNRLFP